MSVWFGEKELLICFQCHSQYTFFLLQKSYVRETECRIKLHTAMTSPPARDFTVHDALSDVTMVVEDTCLYVHRQYLAEWSGVWRNLFVTQCPEDMTSSVEIVLEDKKLEEVTELLHCIYSTQKPISGKIL